MAISNPKKRSFQGYSESEGDSGPDVVENLEVDNDDDEVDDDDESVSEEDSEVGIVYTLSCRLDNAD